MEQSITNKRGPWPDAWLEPSLRAMGLLDAAAEQTLRRSRARTLWQACVREGLSTHADILAYCSKRFSVPVVDLANTDLRESARLLSEETARNLHVVAVRQNGRMVDVACTNPIDVDLERSVAFAVGHRIRLLLADPDSLETALESV